MKPAGHPVRPASLLKAVRVCRVLTREEVIIKTLGIVLATVASVVVCPHAYAQTGTFADPEWRAKCASAFSRLPPERVNKLCRLPPDEALPVPPRPTARDRRAAA